MTTTDATPWIDANQRSLLAELAAVRAALERYAAPGVGEHAVDQAQAPPDSTDTTPTALDHLCRIFGLSSFERAILLLCAGLELDASFADLCATAQGDPSRPYPTFGLALAALHEPHWSALTPAGQLRQWRLIEVVRQPGALLTTSPLRIDERVLHFLTGLNHLDERLVGLVEPVLPDADLVPSHREIARRVGRMWDQAKGHLPLIEMVGPDEPGKRQIAAAACTTLGLRLFAFATEFVPTGAAELEGFVRLWERESALSPCALYVQTDSADLADARAGAALARLLDRTRGPIVVSGRERLQPLRRSILTIDVDKPTRGEQRALWQALLGSGGPVNGRADHLVSQFNLSVPDIRTSAQEAQAEGGDGEALATRLWDAGRSRSRPRLERLAQRIEPVASWDDLVLPEVEMRLLREIAGQVAQRSTVYENWGFGARSRRGLGIHSLFSGASGTGKTMAAEVLANALRLDLYRLDLSGVVSKYIGETEKNLRRVFDAAEDGGAILFFDEADALFGRRSEIKDSHDRYANIEISYLLQRMESYRGLTVLATNRKGDLDPAFLRRLRFVVNFPFPDFAQRVEIWRRAFPTATPTADLDVHRLAQFSVAGGNIHNIALNAAFLAADAGEAVRMTHLLRTARSEFAKIEKPLSEAEIGGWR